MPGDQRCFPPVEALADGFWVSARNDEPVRADERGRRTREVRGCACSGSCADVAVSHTGVADSPPAGGPPPGTQCSAWSFKLRDGRIRTFSETRRFKGERNDMRRAAALYALSRIEHHFNGLSQR